MNQNQFVATSNGGLVSVSTAGEVNPGVTFGRSRSRRVRGQGPLVIDSSAVVQDFIGQFAANEHAAGLNQQSTAVIQYTGLLLLVGYAIISL